MTKCRRCFKNGVSSEGGDFGVCHKHARARCSGCGGVSLGEELCAVCQNIIDDIKRRERANNPHKMDVNEMLDSEDMRRERLYQGKRFFHEAVEIFFQGVLAFTQGARETRIEHHDKAA